MSCFGLMCITPFYHDYFFPEILVAWALKCALTSSHGSAGNATGDTVYNMKLTTSFHLYFSRVSTPSTTRLPLIHCINLLSLYTQLWAVMRLVGRTLGTRGYNCHQRTEHGKSNRNAVPMTQRRCLASDYASRHTPDNCTWRETHSILWQKWRG